MNLKDMEKLGIERNQELAKYLDFTEFDEFKEKLNSKITDVYVNQSSIENLMATFLFATNIKGAISSKHGLNGVIASKVDSETKEDFAKIQKIIDHLDKIKGLIKSLKSEPSNEFVSYTQFGIKHNRLNSHLEELSKAFERAFRLSKGKTNNRLPYYLALRKASQLYCPALISSTKNMTANAHWELFKLKAIYCVFLIQKKLLKKKYGTLKAALDDVENGLENSFQLIEPEFISRLERV